MTDDRDNATIAKMVATAGHPETPETMAWTALSLLRTRLTKKSLLLTDLLRLPKARPKGSVDHSKGLVDLQEERDALVKKITAERRRIGRLAEEVNRLQDTHVVVLHSNNPHERHREWGDFQRCVWKHIGVETDNWHTTFQHTYERLIDDGVRCQTTPDGRWPRMTYDTLYSHWKRAPTIPPWAYEVIPHMPKGKPGVRRRPYTVAEVETVLAILETIARSGLSRHGRMPTLYNRCRELWRDNPPENETLRVLLYLIEERGRKKHTHLTSAQMAALRAFPLTEELRHTASYSTVAKAVGAFLKEPVDGQAAVVALAKIRRSA